MEFNKKEYMINYNDCKERNEIDNKFICLCDLINSYDEFQTMFCCTGHNGFQNTGYIVIRFKQIDFIPILLSLLPYQIDNKIYIDFDINTYELIIYFNPCLFDVYNNLLIQIFSNYKLLLKTSSRLSYNRFNSKKWCSIDIDDSSVKCLDRIYINNGI